MVSVIIPTYSRSIDVISKAIDSILAQTYPEIELIVVDDNAENLTYRTQIQGFICSHPEYNKKIKYIQNHIRLGGGGSRNAGIAIAKGELIAFCDDDARFFPEKLKKQVECLEKNDATLVYCFMQGSHNGKKIWETCHCVEDTPLLAAMTSIIAGTPSVLVKRCAVERVGGFDNIPCKQDAMLELKLAAMGCKFCCVKEILVDVEEYVSLSRISCLSPKTVIGMEALRKEARKNYYQLSRQEIKIVESDFAYKLINIGLFLNQKELCQENLKILFATAPVSIICIKSYFKYIRYTLLNKFN